MGVNLHYIGWAMNKCCMCDIGSNISKLTPVKFAIPVEHKGPDWTKNVVYVKHICLPCGARVKFITDTFKVNR